MPRTGPASDKGKGKAIAIRLGTRKRPTRSSTPFESSESSSAYSEEELASSLVASLSLDVAAPIDDTDYGAAPPVGLGTDALANMVMDTSIVESWWRFAEHKQLYLSIFSKRIVLGERVVNHDGVGNGFVNLIFQCRH